VKSFGISQSNRPGRSKFVTKEETLIWFHRGVSPVMGHALADVGFVTLTPRGLGPQL
jgi:hypothetical protein